MIKRLAVFMLVVLVAILSVAHADDAPAAPPADEAHAPPGVTLLGDKEPVPSTKEQLEQVIAGGGGFIPTGGITYRWRYTYPYLGGFRYGWRYPLGWWNRWGHSIYGGGCGFGRPFGGFYYC
ncbi:hypothetical protein F442_04180 [Phytophthora nicotianae P10297]|uniref:Uncharacterized protein n=4 Tax=Phytophthora nicotianae TaxID=4792 RepID=W2QKF0_PHYN3|nr:hypothetical protein PPTG_08222 [Phytophthora nicotianae INRA-310]ETK92631.1 hypothetical protein L915_04070 [Phytophthora nicotianae]ETO81431.1 hypothetical protein F444_04263 [Phytophthora nicotianae P1976]ETP50557.1 hypothetical protein F442_04180 [Phytophthora nicotianae P10297]KUF98625.1 hypothetical protein AM588_10009388 [Phytophthora nicotianae]ETL99194.1 hypothetical protein L917_03929 [Phytophthora nicotianae]